MRRGVGVQRDYGGKTLRKQGEKERSFRETYKTGGHSVLKRVCKKGENEQKENGASWSTKKGGLSPQEGTKLTGDVRGSTFGNIAEGSHVIQREPGKDRFSRSLTRVVTAKRQTE